MADNDAIKKMATMLQSGATMLDKYCPNCENILFRLKNGKIFCPICQAEVQIQKSSELPKPPEKFHHRNSENNKILDVNLDFFELNNLFAGNFSKFAKKLNETEDLTEIEKLLTFLEKILNILKILRDFQNG
jgi:uncharacterized Zn finger protein (UPF0148 family)